MIDVLIGIAMGFMAAAFLLLAVCNWLLGERREALHCLAIAVTAGLLCANAAARWAYGL